MELSWGVRRGFVPRMRQGRANLLLYSVVILSNKPQCVTVLSQTTGAVRSNAVQPLVDMGPVAPAAPS